MARKAKQVKRAPVKKQWAPLALFDHQQEVVDAYATGINRFMLPWHRRAGKDVFGLDFARERMLERVGNYWHLFPFHTQAKRAIWKGIDARTSERFIDRAFPEHMKQAEHDTDMSVTLKNGAVWQMLGSDNYDRMVGSNPCGVIFSEWSLCDPAAWDYIRPILVENKGWAMFIFTFRGRNHAFRHYENIKDADDWFVSLRTIADTHRRDGSPIVSEEDVQREREQGMSEALIQQEFYCNPDAATSGAIFTRQYERLRQLDPQRYTPNNRVIRIAWGTYAEGIAAVAFQGQHIIAVHRFSESNILDACQHVVRRHAHCQLVHHAVNADPSLFREVDGAGVVNAAVSADEHIRHGLAAAQLATCGATAVAREILADYAMSFAPYRQQADDHDENSLGLTHDALTQALCVMRSAQHAYRPASRPMVYAGDRGVI